MCSAEHQNGFESCFSPFKLFGLVFYPMFFLCQNNNKIKSCLQAIKLFLKYLKIEILCKILKNDKLHKILFLLCTGDDKVVTVNLADHDAVADDGVVVAPVLGVIAVVSVFFFCLFLMVCLDFRWCLLRNRGSVKIQLFRNS